jgi:hypothetical protein
LWYRLAPLRKEEETMLDHAEGGIHVSLKGLSSEPMNRRRRRRGRGKQRRKRKQRRRGMKIVKLVLGYCFEFYIRPSRKRFDSQDW